MRIADAQGFVELSLHSARLLKAGNDEASLF